jgi:oligosaccharide repeat unit polymerase
MFQPSQYMTASTAVILCGLVAISIFLPPSANADVIFFVAALGTGLSLGIATAIEAKAGVRNLIRADMVMLWSLYVLTFLEFLFPQPNVDTLLSPSDATNGTYAVLVALGGLAIGRHLVPPKNGPVGHPVIIDLRPGNVFLLFIIATAFGYFHILLAVDFDPLEVIRQLSLPRFSQSWSRSQFGDAYSLLYEIGALIYLIPPIAGLILGRSRDYASWQKGIVLFVLFCTLYYGFASGTRNVFISYVITFMGVFFLARPRITKRFILLAAIPVAIIMMIATTYMLAFRTTGLENFSIFGGDDRSFFVDYNVVNIANITRVFPDVFGFLGLEVPFNALIRPIPRVLWPEKPAGLSVSIEAALGADSGVTVSCTFVGEAYMAGGLIAVLLVSLAFGAAAALWNRVGSRSNGQFYQLVYVSGFICAALAMRSLLSMMPFMLPTLALWLFGRMWLGQAMPRSASARSSSGVRRVG